MNKYEIANYFLSGYTVASEYSSSGSRYLFVNDFDGKEPIRHGKECIERALNYLENCRYFDNSFKAHYILVSMEKIEFRVSL